MYTEMADICRNAKPYNKVKAAHKVKAARLPTHVIHNRHTLCYYILNTLATTQVTTFYFSVKEHISEPDYSVL